MIIDQINDQLTTNEKMIYATNIKFFLDKKGADTEN